MLKKNLKFKIQQAFLVVKQNVNKIEFFIAIIGGILWAFQSFFYTPIHIHDTALMPQPWFEFMTEKISKDFVNFSYAPHIEKINQKDFIIRSLGTADLSIIIEVPERESFYIKKLKHWPFSHDIYVSFSNFNYSISKFFLPPVLVHLKFIPNDFSDEVKIFKNTETPMDVIKDLSILLNSNSRKSVKVSHIESQYYNDLGYPYISISLPNNQLSQIDSIISSFDRMENIFIHGPMLFKVKTDDKLLGIPFILSFAFISVIPHLLSIAFSHFQRQQNEIKEENLRFFSAENDYIGFLLAAAVRFSPNLVLSLVTTVFLIFDSLFRKFHTKERQFCNIYVFPFLLEVLAMSLIYPERCLKLSEASLLLTILSPISMPILLFIYGKTLFPVIITLFINEMITIYPLPFQLLLSRISSLFSKKKK